MKDHQINQSVYERKQEEQQSENQKLKLQSPQSQNQEMEVRKEIIYFSMKY